MNKNEELARQIYEYVAGFVPEKSLITANRFAGVGEWGQVGTTLLSAAMRNRVTVPTTLVQQALDRWGPQEMGNLYSQFKENWLSGSKIPQAA